MASYEKIYDLKADYELPERIFLDKGTSYVFSVFLSVGGQSLEFTPERGLWRRPEWSSRGGVCEPGGRGLGRGLGAGRGPNPARCLQCSPPKS